MSLFALVDESAEAELLADYLDYLATHPAIARIKALAHEEWPAGPGERVLEVGCGSGHDLARLAAGVTASGLVAGVDLSGWMLRVARTRTARIGRVRLVRASSRRLPVRDGAFDLARCERLLIHDRDPERTVAELVRAVRSGGRVVLVEPDLAGTIVHHEWQELTDRLVSGFVRHNFHTPWAGRALGAWLRGAGLSGVRIEVHAVACDYELADILIEFRSCAQWALGRGMLDSAGAAAWLAGLDALAAEARFTCVVPVFIAGGSKPPAAKGLGHGQG